MTAGVEIHVRILNMLWGEVESERIYGPWSEGGSGNTRSELSDLAEGPSPLQFGDRLHLAGPVMKDLSGTADWWWDSTLREAKS